MKVEILKPTEINAKYIEVSFDDYGYDDLDFYNDYENMKDFFVAYPAFNNKSKFMLKIDIDTGQIVNWSSDLGKQSFMDVKIVDTGEYVLRDENNEVLAEVENYVPNFLEIEDNGYGDYFEFNVNELGYIEHWKPNAGDIAEFFFPQDED